MCDSERIPGLHGPRCFVLALVLAYLTVQALIAEHSSERDHGIAPERRLVHPDGCYGPECRCESPLQYTP